MYDRKNNNYLFILDDPTLTVKNLGGRIWGAISLRRGSQRLLVLLLVPVIGVPSPRRIGLRTGGPGGMVVSLMYGEFGRRGEGGRGRGVDISRERDVWGETAAGLVMDMVVIHGTSLCGWGREIRDIPECNTKSRLAKGGFAPLSRSWQMGSVDGSAID